MEYEFFRPVIIHMTTVQNFQSPASRVQNPESSVQSPESRVQHPTLASRVQEFLEEYF